MGSRKIAINIAGATAHTARIFETKKLSDTVGKKSICKGRVKRVADTVTLTAEIKK